MRWHFDRRIGIDTIIAILVIGGTLLVAWRTMEARVITLETRWDEQSRIQLARDTSDRDLRERNERRLDKIMDDMQRIQMSVARMEATFVVTSSVKK